MPALSGLRGNRVQSRNSMSVAEIGDARVFCTSCGTCAGVCPSSAVMMKEDSDHGAYLPYVDAAKCDHCGICVRVCPGISVDYARINSRVYGRQPTDTYLGNFKDCYVGNSTDYSVRFHSSSGGLVTSLLTFALETGKIDNAIVTTMGENNPFRPRPFVAKTPSEVIAASKSKYCPVPANMLLRRVLSDPGRFAVVGLPCHIHGIRKAEEIFPSIRERIILHFGLFCSHNVNFLGTEYFLRRLGVTKEDISAVLYRGGGWPGPPAVILKDGSRKADTKGIWNKMFAARFFTPCRCMFCRDSTSEFADMSFGDPWLPRFRDEKIGKTIMISRNETGADILRQALLSGKIELSEISANEVRVSQESLLYKKRAVNAFSRLTAQRRDFGPIPASYTIRPTLTDYLMSVLLLSNLKISSIRSMSHILSGWSQIVKLGRGFQSWRSRRLLPSRHEDDIRQTFL